MGLDISVYSKIQRIEPQPEYEDTPDDVAHLCANPDFPGRADEIKDGYYTFDASDDFAAGSYSGYNDWRDQLAELAGYPAVLHEAGYKPPEMSHSAGAWEVEAGPFWELIKFADNEGTIGAAVAAKLAKDFAEFQPKADAHADAWFRSKYADWRRAFEMAADHGAVDFH
jgi:hypothetical protein